MSREPTIDSRGVKYQRAHANQMPGASGLCRLKESNSKKGGAKLNAKTNMISCNFHRCRDAEADTEAWTAAFAVETRHHSRALLAEETNRAEANSTSEVRFRMVV
jgi:hypothetical protein